MSRILSLLLFVDFPQLFKYNFRIIGTFSWISIIRNKSTINRMGRSVPNLGVQTIKFGANSTRKTL